MMMGVLRRIFCAILIIVIGGIAYPQSKERIFFEHYSGELGLSHIGVNTIVQDTRGFLWVGTFDGLNRFDGVNFRVFRHVLGDSTSLVHNRIYSIIEASDGLLWIGTEEGLCVFDPTYEKFFIPKWADFKLQNSRILKLFKDSESRIWALTDKSNLYIIEKDGQSFYNISYQDNSSSNTVFWDIIENNNGVFFLASSTGLVTINTDLETVGNNHIQNYIRSVDLQGDSLLWLGVPDGLTYASYKKNKDKSFAINVIDHLVGIKGASDIHVDDDSNIWIGSQFNGLHKVRKTGKNDFSISNYSNDPEKLNSLSNDRVLCIYEDRQGILWIGTAENGINKYDPSSRGFKKWSRLSSGTFGLKSDNVLSIIEYNDEILFGTRGRGISSMNKTSMEFDNPDYNFDPLNDMSVSSFFVDSGGTLWIGTWRGLYRLLPDNKNIEKIEGINLVVYDISEDDYGNIWIGTRLGLKMLELNPNQTIRLIKDQLLEDENDDSRFIIRKLYNDPFDSSLWVGTWHHGLIRITNLNSVNDRLAYEKYGKDPENEYAIKSDFVTSVIRVSKNSIWVGTEGGGLAHGIISDNGIKFSSYRESDGLSNNVVKRILADQSGFLWITTNNGLNKFSLDDRQFTSYNENDGISSNYFNNAGVKLPDQTILFGGNKGVTIYKPDEIKSDTIPPIPEFGSFQVSYQKIDPLEEINGDVILDKSISKTEHIELSYNQNTFAFELLALQFTDPSKNKFKYRLQGYDQDWIYSREGEYYANYANVTPGKYTFEFSAANSSGIWSPLKSIDITVTPPFWFTWYAFVFYVLLITLAVFYGLKLNRRIVLLKHNVALEKIEKQKSQELTEAKVTFFMNVSHEFKTPITLILGPLQLLLNHFSKDKIARSYLKVIKNQADYLHNLLEQLVYFRKAESAILELKCRHLDITDFIENLIETYKWQADEQRIDMRFIHPGEKVYLWFDPKKMEKVFHNLISNALKNTSPGGHIRLLLSHDEDDNVIIKIKDNGKGISKEHIENIFERFYQVDSSAGGYGIGLSLTKSLIDLHNGNISVSSKEGKGTEFSVLLRSGNEHLTKKQMITEEISVVPEPINHLKIPENSQLDSIMPSNGSELDQKEVVLIVEDNLRMLSFIQNFLSADYGIMTAKNGREALELIDMNLPDLIISDVMMPEMDGIDLLKKIKEDLITCHIPVILLTAKSDVMHRIEGLKHGADHYVSKPFDVNLLIAEVKSIIQNRNKIKERIKSNLPFDLSKENVHPLDIKLLENIKEIVAENYNNPDFDSNIFSKKTYMNRSQFFKKMKALTNQTPTEYIREYRMNKAVEFLVKEKTPISEVNYKVGISSRSYFNKCFKEIYGASPSEFLKKKDLIKS